MDAQIIAATLSGLVAIWGWWRSFEFVKEAETDEYDVYGIGVCFEMVLVALAASAACAASLWNA